MTENEPGFRSAQVFFLIQSKISGLLPLCCSRQDDSIDASGDPEMSVFINSSRFFSELGSNVLH